VNIGDVDFAGPGVAVIPYPPGIPIVMPGENVGPAAEEHCGAYHIYCVKG
jgi:hypothetical protein